MAYDFISQILKDGEFSESKIGSKSEFEKVGIIATRLLKELGTYSPETAKKTTEENSDFVNVCPCTFFHSPNYHSRCDNSHYQRWTKIDFILQGIKKYYH